MKVIFLDFDGVINSFFENDFDDLCARILKFIVNKTNAKIVVTASAKEQVQLGFFPFENSPLYHIYIKNLAKYNLVPYDYTPLKDNRENEIKYYLETHPEITEFLILDDNSLLKDFNGHQVLIDDGWGLTLKDIRKSIQILQGNLQYYDLSKIELDPEKRCIQSNLKFQYLKKRK